FLQSRHVGRDPRHQARFRHRRHRQPHRQGAPLVHLPRARHPRGLVDGRGGAPGPNADPRGRSLRHHQRSVRSCAAPDAAQAVRAHPGQTRSDRHRRRLQHRDPASARRAELRRGWLSLCVPRREERHARLRSAFADRRDRGVRGGQLRVGGRQRRRAASARLDLRQTMPSESKGEPGFARHYTALFGERWPELRQALLAASPKVLRVNRFASEAARQRDTRDLAPLPSLPGCYRLESASERVALGPDEHELWSAYVMDAASVVAARALEVRPGEAVLDLCAAPGGKALILLEALASAGNLTLNDRSRKRSARLKTVLRQYVPANVLERVKLTTHDARRWGLYQPAAYDAILLDAPCSSE